MLAAVIDADDVRVLEPRRRFRLAPEPLDELLVLREAPVQHLERDLTAEMRVLGAVDVRHPAGADPLDDPVAAVDCGVVGDLGHCRSASITVFAIGAATVPPSPCVRSSVTAIATFGSSTGAKPMNHESIRCFSSILILVRPREST